MIKLVLLDVDGTLTNKARELSTKAIDAIRKVQSEGVLVSLASGNVVPVMYGLKIFLGLNAPVFAENGGAMFQDEMQIFFSKEKPLALFNRLEAEGVLEGILSNRWRETSCGYVPAAGKEALVSEMAKEADLVTVDSGYSWHLLNKGQDKGFALEHLKKMYNLNYGEILVMGDSFNDLPMFKEGVVKSAPHNAEKVVKDVADYVASNRDGDGAAEVLMKLDEF